MSPSVLRAVPADSNEQIRGEVAVPRAAKLLGTSIICRRLGISRHTWVRWVKSRQAPAPVPNLPGHPRWAASDIDRFERGRYWQGAR